MLRRVGHTRATELTWKTGQFSAVMFSPVTFPWAPARKLWTSDPSHQPLPFPLFNRMFSRALGPSSLQCDPGQDCDSAESPQVKSRFRGVGLFFQKDPVPGPHRQVCQVLSPSYHASDWVSFYVCMLICMHVWVHLCEVRLESRENFAIVPLTLSTLLQRQSFSLVSAFQEGKAGWTVGPRHLLISPSLVLESQVPVTVEVPGLELTSSALTQLAQL